MSFNIVDRTEETQKKQREYYPGQRRRMTDILLEHNLPTFKEDMAAQIHDIVTKKTESWRDPRRASIGAYDVAPEEAALLQELIGTARGLRGAEGRYGARKVDMSRATQRNRDLLREYLGKTGIARTMLGGQRARQSTARIAQSRRKTWEKSFWRSQEQQRKAAEERREQIEDEKLSMAIAQILGLVGSVAGTAVTLGSPVGGMAGGAAGYAAGGAIGDWI